MQKLIDDYFKALDCFGWEKEISIKKGGVLDVATDSLHYLVKSDDGFNFNGYIFKYQ